MFILQKLSQIIYIVNKFLGEKQAKIILNLATNKQIFFNVNKIYNPREGNILTNLTLLLPGKGCAWAEKTGGCTMCGLWQKAKEMGKKFSGDDLVSLFEIADILTKKENPSVLTIYNGGSFLNNDEIPFEVQLNFCRKVKKHLFLKKLFIESRVEYIDNEKIQILKKEIGNKKLMIGIGLEAVDDTIRNTVIKKGLSKNDYENTIKLLKENGIETLTYVFLKPIYSTEQQAIKEAIATIKYAFMVGTDEVALETAFIQNGTPMAELFKKKEYKPPWLWSIIEVVKKTYRLGPIYIGTFEDEPPPIAIPFNCSLCSSKIQNLLQEYRESQNISLFNNLHCDCHELWKNEINN